MLLQVTETEEADRVVLLARRFDASVAEEFKREALALAGRGRRMELDLGGVEFIDSSALGALVAVLKAIGDPGRLVLLRPTRQVRKVFDLTRLTSVFRIVDDQSAG